MPKSNLEKFMQARGIPGPARWKILTARAHALTDEELEQAKAMLIAEREQRLKALRELDAPAVLIQHEEKMLADNKAGTSRFQRVLARVIASRQGKV